MKEEEERRIALMTRREFEQIASAASKEALSWTDATLEDVEAIDKMARGQPAPKRSLDSSNLHTNNSGPHSIPYTAKGERLLRERLEREGEPLPEDLENLDNLSPEEKKAMDAERRAAWRKARLKSLENDAIQAQLVIQKMSELPTQESSDDLDPISESPSKTLDEEDDEHESSSENDETLEDDDVVPDEPVATVVVDVENNVNANLDFRSSTADVENNIPRYRRYK